MSAASQIAPLATVLCALVLAACAGGNDATEDSAAAAAAAPPAAAQPRAISLAEAAGKWNLRAVPETGPDTMPTLVVLTATADTTGWTLTFPNQPPVKLKVRMSGDSIITESEPYNSTRRSGAKVTTRGSMRMQGDSLVGITTAHYAGAGADSVLRMRTTGKRAP